MNSFTVRDVETGQETVYDITQDDGTFNAVPRDEPYGDGVLDDRCATEDEVIDDVIEYHQQSGSSVERVGQGPGEKTMDYQLQEIDPSDITAGDLMQVIADEGGYEAYRVFRIGDDGYQDGVAGQMIYSVDRAGIFFGGDSDWTDCSSAEDAMERWLGIDGKEMVN